MVKSTKYEHMCITVGILVLMVVFLVPSSMNYQFPHVEDNNKPNSAKTYQKNTNGYANGVFVSGNYAYVADGDSGLAVIDISDPTNLGTPVYVDTPGKVNDVNIFGDYAYMAVDDFGLMVIDISDPTNPGSPIYRNETYRSAFGVFVIEDYAYMASSLSLATIDISDPNNPGSPVYVDLEGDGINVFVRGDYAFVSAFDSGLAVIDISDPSHPSTPSYVDTNGDACDVCIKGGYAYIADYFSGLAVLDISDPTRPGKPVYSDSNRFSLQSIAYGVYVEGDYAYLADGFSGLAVVDISNPSQPGEYVYIDTPGVAHDVFINGSYAYVADGSSGLVVIDISNPPQIEEGNSAENGFLISVVIFFLTICIFGGIGKALSNSIMLRKKKYRIYYVCYVGVIILLYIVLDGLVIKNSIISGVWAALIPIVCGGVVGSNGTTVSKPKRISSSIKPTQSPWTRANPPKKKPINPVLGYLLPDPQKQEIPKEIDTDLKDKPSNNLPQTEIQQENLPKTVPEHSKNTPQTTPGQKSESSIYLEGKLLETLISAFKPVLDDIKNDLIALQELVHIEEIEELCAEIESCQTDLHIHIETAQDELGDLSGIYSGEDLPTKEQCEFEKLTQMLSDKLEAIENSLHILWHIEDYMELDSIVNDLNKFTRVLGEIILEVEDILSSVSIIDRPEDPPILTASKTQAKVSMEKMDGKKLVFPTNIQDYSNIKSLGKGGMGEVFLVKYAHDGKQYALKKFHDGQSKTIEKYWKREVKILKRQNKSPARHVEYYTSFTSTGAGATDYYILMEYLETANMEGWIHRKAEIWGGMPDQTEINSIIQHILLPVCSHLNFIHQLGIIHRDLTPRNILILEENAHPVPVIIDWGVAREIPHTKMYNPPKPFFTKHTTSMATGIHSVGNPPEVLRGYKPIAASDIYMFGNIMYYLLSGGKYLDLVEQAMAQFELSLEGVNPAVSLEINSLLREITKYEPADRIPTFALIYERLHDLLSD